LARHYNVITTAMPLERADGGGSVVRIAEPNVAKAAIS
jgi:hypothetical protein